MVSRTTLTSAISVSLLTLTYAVRAQDAGAATPAAPQTPAEAPAEALAKAIGKMAMLNGIRFQTSESQNTSMARSMQRQAGGALPFGGGATTVDGSQSQGILRASVNDDADKIASYRGRMIARSDNIGWKLRRNRTANGATLPFVLDPSRFFEALQALPKGAFNVTNSEKTTYKGKELMLVGLTLEGEDAQDFALSGALPAVSDFGTGMVIRAFGGGMAQGVADLPDVTVDLALYVDPTTSYIHRVTTRSYQKSAIGGGAFQIQVQGAGLGGGDTEEEEEVKDKDEHGKRIYKKGLPVRKLENGISLMEYDVTFTEHDMPVKLDLDPKASQLLRLPVSTTTTPR